MYLTFDIVNTNDFYSVSSVKQLGFLFFIPPQFLLFPFPSFKYSKAGKPYGYPA